ncbi:nitroreductase family protein [Reichenbachiella versicolor]|uniref:nitroreductase family protein n=1 Tax=Reichenbachiella versicolor TaxID=1821036 RepID=UPI000D6E202C|nr:nitroreductase [Reichenbachiella versicolor]
MAIDPKQLDELIKSRRSVFPANYTGEKVDDQIIEQMLENANWAPTHKYTEPWRFVVFTEGGIKSFANYQADKYLEKEGDQSEANKEKKLRTKPLAASHIIAICMKRNNVIPEWEEVAAVSCAVQNMLLTAQANGIGAYWSTGGVTFYKDVNAHFGLGSEDKLLGFLYVGVPKVKNLPKGKRKPIEDKVNWVIE